MSFLFRYLYPPLHFPISQHTDTRSLIFTSAYLSSVSHIDEGTHWLEGTSATGQKVGAVVGLQEADKVGTLRLNKNKTQMHPD